MLLDAEGAPSPKGETANRLRGQSPAPTCGGDQRRASVSPAATWRVLCEPPWSPRLTKPLPLPPAEQGGSLIQAVSPTRRP